MQAETVVVAIKADGTIEKEWRVFRSTPAYAARRKCLLTGWLEISSRDDDELDFQIYQVRRLSPADGF
jgi:hypothetical protein